MTKALQAFDLVIFDWDGTLFNSVGQIVKSLHFAAERYQQPLTDAAAQSIIGLGLPEVMQILFPQVPELHQEILEAYAAHYVENSGHDRWFDGVAEMLQQLQQRDVLLAVATGKSRAGLDRVLAQTQSQSMFCITRAASETRSKPDPLMLEEILEHTGVSVERAVMVGDSSYDLEMAQRIGMRSIGVSYGVHRPEVLLRYQPQCIVHNIAELQQQLLRSLALTSA